MSPPRVLRTVAVIPLASSCCLEGRHIPARVLGFRGLSSTWFSGIRLTVARQAAFKQPDQLLRREPPGGR